MKIVSLASANVTINNPNRGYLISFGGAGKMMGSISYSFANDWFSGSGTPDGGYAFAHNASKFGSITISFTQSSPHIDTLCEYLIWCRDNPELAAANITITDSTGIINVEAKDCLPTKYPDNSLTDLPQTRQFTFACGEITPKEYLVGGN